MFQSLSGFRVRCNGQAAIVQADDDMFQSLSGFRVRCNPRQKRDITAPSWVSIPIGFSSTLQLHESGQLHRRRSVSIPIGFSSTLQPSRLSLSNFQTFYVSIPIGFSSTLQRRIKRLPYPLDACFNPYRVFEYVATETGDAMAESMTVFQSLSGFRVRCNHDIQVVCRVNPSVSIPIGFSSTLQRGLWKVDVCRRLGFQSLSGFRVRCNPSILC